MKGRKLFGREVDEEEEEEAVEEKEGRRVEEC